MAEGGLEQLLHVLPRAPQLGCRVPRRCRAQRTPSDLLRRRGRKGQLNEDSRTSMTARTMGKNQYLGGEEDAADRGPAGDPAAEEVVDGHVGAAGV